METKKYTSEDFWTLPEGERAELVDGELYDMASPSTGHQRIVTRLALEFGSHIRRNGGACEVFGPSPAVNPDGADKDWVVPDLSVICDQSKLTEKACVGAPDMVVEVASPSNRKYDYSVKYPLYSRAGVREIWIVDAGSGTTAVFLEENDYAPSIYPFGEDIPCSVLRGLSVNIGRLLG